MNYQEEGTIIWRRFVPPAGQAVTVQGELLRAVEKLRDEAARNGNANWDQGFEILLSYLERHLLDPAVYAADQIERTRQTLTRLRVHDQPLLDDAPYDDLGDRVVDYFRHYGSQSREWNPHLDR